MQYQFNAYAKITDNLTYEGIKKNFFIGFISIVDSTNIPFVTHTTLINHLEAAIEDGTLDKQIEDCAKYYLKGDIKSVVATMYRDVVTTHHSETMMMDTDFIDEHRIWTLRTYLRDKLRAICR